MEQTLDFVFALLVGLLAFLLRIAIAVERFMRIPMHRLGIDERAQGIAIVVVAVFLVLTGYRLFGGLIGILVTIFLVLMMAHILLPDLLLGLEKS